MVEATAAIGSPRAALQAPGNRAEKLRRAAAVIREAGPCRWVGIDDALARAQTVVVGDVKRDPRCLTTFASTRSEIVVPILDSVSGRPRATLDVESDRPEAFDPEDRAFVEHCAAEIAAAESPSSG